jgi:hypothetical protein
MINRIDYVELGLACAHICAIFERGLEGKGSDNISDSVREVIKELTT